MHRIQSCRVVMNGGYAHVQWWSLMDIFMRRAGQWWICSCEYVAVNGVISSFEAVVNGGICSCELVANGRYAHVQ